MLRPASIVILSVSVAALLARAEEPISEDLQSLQGEWVEVERDTLGKKTSDTDAGFKPSRFLIAGNQLIVNGRKKTIKLDRTTSPKQIDMLSHDGQETGQTTAAIYKLERDRLTICMPYWNGNTAARPTDFKAGADDGLMLTVLKRVSP